jgi:hypothetical protein
MTKYSTTKKDRLLDWNDKEGVHRRPEPKPGLNKKNVGNCMFCELPVYVSQGQLLVYLTDKFGVQHPTHKSCRKENQR